MEINTMNSLFFTNLQLLGLDIDFMEETYKIPFQKNMFCLPNKAGSEAVLHFLFTRLNPLLAKEQFRDCWPIIDKNSELQFRKVCKIWLTQIQEEPDAHLPRISVSLFLTPGGRKFIHVVYSFSTYVLNQVMKTEQNWNNQVHYPDLSLNISTRLSVTALNDYTVKECNEFFDKLHLSVALNRMWKLYASDLVKEYRKIKKLMRERESEKKFLEKGILDAAVKHHGEKVVSKSTCVSDYWSEKRMQRINLAIKNWKNISAFYDILKSEREIVQSVVDNRFSKYVLDATVMGIKVPNLLLKESSKIFLELEVDNIYSGGCLNLVTMLLLWTVGLKIYKERLLIEKRPNFSSVMPMLITQVQKHLIHLKTTKDLRGDVIKKTLQCLTHTVDVLKKKYMKRSKTITNVSLGLTTPTKKSEILSPATHRLEASDNLITASVQGPIASLSQNNVPVTVFSTSPVLKIGCSNQVLSLPKFSKRSLKDLKKDKVTSLEFKLKERERKLKDKKTFFLKQNRIETNIQNLRKDGKLSYTEMAKNTKLADDLLVDEVVDSVLIDCNNSLNINNETEEKIGGLIPLRLQECEVNSPSFLSKTHNLEDVENILLHLNIVDLSQTSIHVDSRPEYVHVDTRPEYVYVDTRPEYVHVDTRPEYVHVDSRPEYVHVDSRLEHVHVDTRPEYVHNDFETEACSGLCDKNVQKSFNSMQDKMSLDLFHLSAHPTDQSDISTTGNNELGDFMAIPAESFGVNSRKYQSTGTEETSYDPNSDKSDRSFLTQLSPFTDQLNDFIQFEDNERPDCLIEYKEDSNGASSLKTIQEKLSALKQKASDILDISFDSSASSEL